ncbi:MAG: hypothetical protein LBF25_00480 [Puniceicoccales bacterium]|nr:hypothetical protein [Puniceicoccales bacterium]
MVENGLTSVTVKEVMAPPIHVAATTGHPRNEAHNKVYCCHFQENKFYNANAILIKNFVTQGAINISEMEVVYDASLGKS